MPYNLSDVANHQDSKSKPCSADRVNNSEQGISLSIVVPISERHDDMNVFYRYYEKEFAEIKMKYEVIFVLNEGFEGVFNVLKKLRESHKEIKIIKLNRDFGEAAALSVGFKKAQGEYIITLHPYIQTEPSGIKRVIKKLDEGYDLVVTRRHPRVDSLLNRIQTHAFHAIIRWLTGISYRDISCGLRGMRKQVSREINLYGDLHRFIPILAHMQGFKISEIDVKQSLEEASVRVYRVGVYLRRVLDIFTIFFLFKFTKKPLRFFGLIGISFFAAGLSINLYLTYERLVGLIGLANRPLLLLGVLAMVLGIQIASIGLLGEIIIFTHARDFNDYQIEQILD